MSDSISRKKNPRENKCTVFPQAKFPGKQCTYFPGTKIAYRNVIIYAFSVLDTKRESLIGEKVSSIVITICYKNVRDYIINDYSPLSSSSRFSKLELQVLVKSSWLGKIVLLVLFDTIP